LIERIKMSLRRALLIAAILSSPFAAVGEEVTVQAKQESKKHFQQGDAYVQAGAYKSAAEEFLEAYRLWPNERFHYNIAQAYRLGGEKEKAVEHYKRYLAAVGEGDTANDARQQLALLMTDIERKQAARAVAEKAKAEAPAATDAKAAAETKAAAAAKAAQETNPGAQNLAATPPQPKKKPYWAIGVALGVVAVAALGIGLGVGLSGSAPSPTLGTVTLVQK
jgi:tetratricopeptide (TPR) repeat protein